MNYPEIIHRCSLFSDIPESELPQTLARLRSREKDYPAGSFILSAGDHTRAMGLVIEGTVLVIQEDFWGNRSLIAQLSAGELFAESFACCPSAALNVSVTADSACRILWLDAAAILDGGGLVRRLLSEISSKNLMLSEKLTHLGKRSTRAKLLSYLSAAAQRSGSREFDIPFTRQQLADYLLVERSAMSAELGRLKKEGVIDFERNHFILKN